MTNYRRPPLLLLSNFEIETLEFESAFAKSKVSEFKPGDVSQLKIISKIINNSFERFKIIRISSPF